MKGAKCSWDAMPSKLHSPLWCLEDITSSVRAGENLLAQSNDFWHANAWQPLENVDSHWPLGLRFFSNENSSSSLSATSLCAGRSDDSLLFSIDSSFSPQWQKNFTLALSLSLTFVCSTPLTSSLSLVDAQHKTLPIGMNIFANTISDVPSWLIAYHEYFFFLQWEFGTWDVTVEYSTIWNFCCLVS